MSYSYKTERMEFTCQDCNHRQYAIGNICLKCGVKNRMYNKRRCKMCGEMITGDNIYVQRPETGYSKCKACTMEKNRKNAIKSYHMKKLRNGEMK